MKANLQSVPDTRTAAVPGQGRGSAIVVDDHRRMRRLESDLLHQYLPHFDVQEAQDAESAIEAASGCRPDLVLMDVHLPGIDGLEATRRILEIAPDAMIIVISLADDWRFFRLAIAAGARAFVPKADLMDGLPPLIEHFAGPFHGPTVP
jgi:DNA-binding NarL/FixJ family response regulator